MARHPGQRLTGALLESAYYWPQMQDEVEAYVRTCLVCQQDKEVLDEALQTYGFGASLLHQFTHRRMGKLRGSEAINKSPFELATGQQPLTPHTLTIGYTGRSPAAFKFAKGGMSKLT
ncbi:hypothetical protein CK203_052417 [Vitis vinifera]|uniref:Integrase zinc-binding domain-containing protein n=1 Tax=Vitis vinifera TaxID=29760 RepID=A0A438H6K9_VITVI|nr:hypothetical protein CK203_052417 [Vitis vinifera]